MRKFFLGISLSAILIGISFVGRAQYAGGAADGGSEGVYTASVCAAPVNSNVYFGGVSDGGNFAALTVSACPLAQNNNIFFGGIEDGHSSDSLRVSVCPLPQNNNIFFGGIEDGFSSDSLRVAFCPIPQNNNIFFGGIEDGFSSDSLRVSFCPIPQNANVFFGGIEDGFSSGALTASVCPPPANVNIYFGGLEDGFSSQLFKNIVDPCVLALQTIAFAGICVDQSKVLKWSTASEQNQDFFIVEYSADGGSWEPIGTVQGAGASSTVQNYTFTDAGQRSEPSYYRMIQSNPDGRSSYSAIIVMESCVPEAPDADKLVIYPNPSFGVFNLSFDGDRTKPISIEVYNVLEEMVYHTGSFRSALDLTDLASGVYFVHFISDGKTIIKKIVIRR
jgi:hypothetical protein